MHHRPPASDLAAAWDPDRFRREGHDLVERLATWLEQGQRGAAPVVGPLGPEAMTARWALGEQDAPWLDRLLQDAVRAHHPGNVAHQVAPVLPLAALADLASSLLNNGMAAYESGPPSSAMEEAVVGWFAERAGLGDGLLTSGGSLGNLTALLAMRRIRGSGVLLVGDQSHYSIARAAAVLGLEVVAVETDERYRLRGAALTEAFDDVRLRGDRVVGVVASAGSTSTGAIDSLEEISAQCVAADAWLHVDGAHGASALLSTRHRERLQGIGLADSLVWDAHKLMHLPAAITVVLFARREHATVAFAQEASYLFQEPRRLDRGLRTLECTKRMMAVPAWVALSELGAEHFEAALDACFDLAAIASVQVASDPRFELATVPDTNIVCFRWRAVDDAGQDRLRLAVNLRGNALLSRTVLRGRTWLRMVWMNPLAVRRDVTAVLQEVVIAAGTT